VIYDNREGPRDDYHKLLTTSKKLQNFSNVIVIDRKNMNTR